MKRKVGLRGRITIKLYVFFCVRYPQKLFCHKGSSLQWYYIIFCKAIQELFAFSHPNHAVGRVYHQGVCLVYHQRPAVVYHHCESEYSLRLMRYSLFARYARKKRMRYTLMRDDMPLLSQWIKKSDKMKLVGFFGWGIGIRTPTNRVRVCRAAVTQFPNVLDGLYFSTVYGVCQEFFCIYFAFLRSFFVFRLYK